MSVAWVGAGISAVSALSGASAAGDAADAQRQSAADANALSREQFEQTRADTAPTRERGNQAGNRLQYLMGLDGGAGGGTGGGGQYKTLDQFRNELIAKQGGQGGGLTGPNDPGWQWEGVSFGADGLPIEWIKGKPHRIVSNGSAEDYRFEPLNLPPPSASRQSVDVSAEAQALFDQQEAQRAQSRQQASSDPEFGSLMRNFSAADRDADPLYAQLRPQIDQALDRSSSFEKSPLYGTFTKALERANGSFETAPGYQFRLAEGMKGVENSGAARGLQLSGAGLKAINRFNQDFASNEYGNWFNQTNTDRNFASNEYGNWFNQSNTDRNFVAGQGDAAYNRFNNNNTNKYNRLAGIAGTGQQATRDVNSAGAAYAQNAGNNIMGAGNAQAAGIVGGANALNQGVSQGYNMYQNNQLMDLIRKPQTSTGWGSGGGWMGGGRVVPDYPGAEY